MKEHECIIGIAFFDGDKRTVTENDVKFLIRLNIDWRWCDKFNYCPICGRDDIDWWGEITAYRKEIEKQREI